MNLTKVILIVTLFVVSGEAYSNPVDKEMAKIVAQNFMSRSRSASKMVSDVVTEQFEGHNSFYVVNFREGGWVMVSAENSTVPVLAFSIDGAYHTDDEKPDGLLYMIGDYKEQVNVSRKTAMTRNNEVVKMWSQLLVDEDGGNISRQSAVSNTMAYTPGTRLLNDPARGEVAWGQDINNDGGCNPSYNSEIKKKWNHGWFTSCDCGSPPVGCGAVAIGQLLWYWKWPQSSTYRTYNWNLMPNRLVNSTPSAESKEVAQLLLDCAEASNMTYACAGSFTTKVDSALKHTFGYSTARKVKRSDLSVVAWNDLIRTEISRGRPVIMYGAKALTIDKKHYFIIDGYASNQLNYFHINFGWRGSYTNNYYYLDNINPGSSYYSDHNYAIVDIFPPPTISGPALICEGSTYTFSATNWNPNFTWEGSNLTITGSGNSVLVSGTGNGDRWVSIKDINNNELTRLNFWIGPPIGISAIIDNPDKGGVIPRRAYYQASYYPDFHYEEKEKMGPLYFSWGVTPQNGSPQNGASLQEAWLPGNYRQFVHFTEFGYYEISCSVSNACGSKEPATKISVQSGNVFKAYPVPATTRIWVDFYKPGTYSLTVMDIHGNVLIPRITLYSSLDLNISQYPSGVYYMFVYVGTSTIPEMQVVVKE